MMRKPRKKSTIDWIVSKTNEKYTYFWLPQKRGDYRGGDTMLQAQLIPKLKNMWLKI